MDYRYVHYSEYDIYVVRYNKYITVLNTSVKNLHEGQVLLLVYMCEMKLSHEFVLVGFWIGCFEVCPLPKAKGRGLL